jgi:hypothetical protein
MVNPPIHAVAAAAAADADADADAVGRPLRAELQRLQARVRSAIQEVPTAEGANRGRRENAKGAARVGRRRWHDAATARTTQGSRYSPISAPLQLPRSCPISGASPIRTRPRPCAFTCPGRQEPRPPRHSALSERLRRVSWHLMVFIKGYTAKQRLNPPDRADTPWSSTVSTRPACIGSPTNLHLNCDGLELKNGSETWGAGRARPDCRLPRRAPRAHFDRSVLACLQALPAAGAVHRSNFVLHAVS